MYIKKQLTFLELVFIYYHWVHHCVHWVPCSYTISFNLLNNPLRCYYHCFKGGWIRSWGRVQFSSVQFSCSVVSSSLQPHELQHVKASLSITNSWSSLKLMFIESVMPSSFSIIPSKEIPGLIFRMDWLDLLAVQGTLKSLLQHHSSKASILRLSAFFIVQLSHPYMTTGKTIALTRQTLVGKVMSLLFNMLSRFLVTSKWNKKQLIIQDKVSSLPYEYQTLANNKTIYFYVHEIHINIMKRPKDLTLKDKLRRSEVVHCATGEK